MPRKAINGYRKNLIQSLPPPPQNWYILITRILTNMGLSEYWNYPCLLYGIVNDYAPISVPLNPIHDGLYVNNFVVFFKSDTKEQCFRDLL